MADGAQALRDTAPYASSSVSTASSSLWDRVSTWASENKTVVYTIAGVTLVATGAGVVYYVSGSGADGKGGETVAQRKSKKERREAKKKAQESVQRGAPAEPVSPGSVTTDLAKSI